MVYSYTQISQYLRCPRSYRYRYLDGWQEKETRSGMAFGRCFENALGAYFRNAVRGTTHLKRSQTNRGTPCPNKTHETSSRPLHETTQLLETFTVHDHGTMPEIH